MDCKNCSNSLRTDYSYCPDCGAKVIRNKLTIKNLWHDVTERFFNIDNTVLKTFLHLFSKPEIVIQGYISGVRKKYMNPIGYLTIALTASGFMLFFLKRAFPEGIDFSVMGTQTYSAEASMRLTQFMFTFYSLLFLLYIPILAFSGWLVFNEKRLNFTEYIVFFVYTQAQYSLFSIPITLLIIWTIPERYTSFSFFTLALMLTYSLYALKKHSALKGKEFVLKCFLFLLIFGCGYIVMVIFQFILMFLTGTLSFSDFAPKT